MLIIGGCPNLELLDLKAQLALLKRDPKKYADACLNVEVFVQCWPSTALGFGGMAGQALSVAYTTVFSDIEKDVYVVFFGGQFAYIVEDPNEKFFSDLTNRSMAPVSKALKIY